MYINLNIQQQNFNKIKFTATDNILEMYCEFFQSLFYIFFYTIDFVALVFASGLATTTAITYLLQSGDHIVSMDDLYGG